MAPDLTISPLSGAISPLSNFSSVDLPAPLRPSSPIRSPSSIRSDAPSSRSGPPKLMETSFIQISAIYKREPLLSSEFEIVISGFNCIYHYLYKNPRRTTRIKSKVLIATEFLNKDIEVIKVGKGEYEQTPSVAKKKKDVKSLIEDHEA